MIRSHRLVRAALLAGLLAGTAAAAPVRPPKPAARIVSLVPSITECLFAAGAGSKVVAVSEHCDYPPEVRRLPRVGSWKAEDAPGIMAWKPDLVAGGCCNGAALLAALRSRGARVMTLDPLSLDQVVADVRALGKAAGTSARAEEAARGMERVLERVRASAAASAPARRPAVLVGSPRAGAWLPGPGTYIDDLIRRAGGVNAVSKPGWSAHTEAEVRALRPDVVVMPRSGEEAAPSRERLPDALCRDWPASSGDRAHGLPSGWLHRPGPRLFRALEALAGLLRSGPAVGTARGPAPDGPPASVDPVAAVLLFSQSPTFGPPPHPNS